MGFIEVLTLIFVVLKLMHVINWSWWLVLMPELLALGLYVLALILAGIAFLKGG